MIGRDLVFAMRTLLKSPVFALTAVVTIALGIGASTAIFSVTNAVLLRPLPYKDPERLVLACHDLTKRSVKDFPFSNADYIDLRNGAKGQFEDLAGIFTFRNVLPRGDGSPEQVRMAAVTANFFQVLGARIAFGRDFTDADGQPQAPPPPGAAPGAGRLPPIAIVSYAYFQRRFGGNTAVLGRPMATGGPGGPVIVGVLAPGFELLLPPSVNEERFPDIWVADRLAYDATQRNNVSLRVIGRLKNGATLDRAQTEADAVAAEGRRTFPMHATSGYYIRLVPMNRHLVEEVRPAILALMGAVIFLLLIACANVANLMLVRSSLRERELAVRTALGGSRWRLVRQMLAEALMLAGGGTLLGLGLAWAGIHELLAIAPANLPRLDSIRIDPVVLAFTALSGLAAAIIFGLPPALRASRPNVMHVLRASGRTSSLGGGRMLRNAVVIAEVALSFVLLIGSGLMFRSFRALQQVDPGYDSHRLLTFLLLGGRDANTPQQRAAAVRDVHNRLSTMPGVESVTAATPFPLAGQFSPVRWGTEEALVDPTKFQAADLQAVLPGYFETMRTRLIAGRTFTEEDNEPDRKRVIIDEFLAAKAFPSQSAIGKRILERAVTQEAEWAEVIGVIGHQREKSLTEPGREQIYFSDGFFGHGLVQQWALRTSGDPAKYADQVRAEIAKADSLLLITELQPMGALVDRAQAGTRFSLLLIGVFAVIAVLLAGVGLYGVLSTVVRQRTAEIGVRMALGAAPVKIFSLVVTHGLQLSATGIAAGILAALGLTQLMTSMLVGVKATDPATFIAMAALFFGIAALASWLPARRAAGLDPTVALRED